MKWIDIKEIMEENFPPEGAMVGDVIGELVPVPEEITGIMVTLDVTLDVIAQAMQNKCNLIIAHHPFYWGESAEEALARQTHLKPMYDLLVKSNIGVYAAHTNADFAPNSIAYMQALALDLQNIEQNDQNLSVSGYFEEEKSIAEISELLKDALELKDAEFRSNIEPEMTVKKITIASGAGGEYGIVLKDSDALHIVGEIKHHEWVRANERGVKVLELNHFSERIFKTMVELFMKEEGIEVELSHEEPPYKLV